jgi:hypothetical protein
MKVDLILNQTQILRKAQLDIHEHPPTSETTKSTGFAISVVEGDQQSRRTSKRERRLQLRSEERRQEDLDCDKLSYFLDHQRDGVPRSARRSRRSLDHGHNERVRKARDTASWMHASFDSAVVNVSNPAKGTS